MVDYCSVAAAPKFFNGRSNFRGLSSSAASTDADGRDAPLNLCIKSEPQTAAKQEYCQSIEHEKQQAGRLKIFGRGGQRFSGCNENEEHSNQRHSSGESMDSGIYIGRHYSGDNSNGMIQYHDSEQAITTGNSVDSGIFIQRNFGGGIEGQRHDSGGSNGSTDSCQELGNLLIVSALDTDIANEEIVECEENVIMEEYDDNLIIDDNAGGCERMDETGNNIARESKPGAQDLAIRMVTVNKEYNNKNKNIPSKLEYLQGEGGQLRYAEPDNSVQQLETDNCIQRSYSVGESSQDSLEILATAASAERAATIRRTTSEPARAAPTPAELAVSLADGPLHLLAAIAISAKANTNLSQLPASSISSTSSFTTSSTNHKNQKSSARHKETASSINTTREDQDDESPAAAVASAKRLRYHSWPQMATMTSSQRKKEQNKLASKRFRERKKQQMEHARIEIAELEVRNDLLRKKEEYMRSELENLRRVLLERNLIKIVQLPDGQTQVIATVGDVKKSFTTKLK